MMDVLIVDDGSADARIATYCAEQKAASEITDFHIGNGLKPKGKRTGGLHHNMQFALDWASLRDYDVMLTMQDDMQCLWGDESVLDDVARFFQKCENAIFLQSRFCRRAAYYGRLRYDYDFDSYRIRRGCNDVGFYNVNRARASGFKFGANERESSENADRLGFFGYQMACPILADIPLEAQSVKEFVLQKSGYNLGDSPDAAVPVLRDLRRQDIKHLKTRNRKIPPFGEDYVYRSDGAGLIFPHWFTRNAPERYVEVLTATYKLERKWNTAPLPISNETGSSIFGKKLAIGKKPGVFRAYWRQATKRYRYVSIAEYIIQKIRLFVFFYFQYGRMKKWFTDSSRSLSDE